MYSKLFRILAIKLFLLLLIKTNEYDYTFYYDNSNEEIYFDFEKNISSYTNFKENDLLNYQNKQNEYISSAKKNKFIIEYYSCLIPNLSTSLISLIRVSFDITKPEKTTVKEIFLNLEENSEKKIVFPKKYKSEFTIQQNKTASNEGRKNINSLIYDTFGFNIKSKNNFNFQIAKLLLVNFRKNKVNYLANLSRNIYIVSRKDNSFIIYLENLPEKFDLYATLEIFDKDWKSTGEKILVVQKDFIYPNYKVEDDNPNKNFFIISLVFISIAFILTFVFILIKLICS